MISILKNETISTHQIFVLAFDVNKLYLSYVCIKS